MRNLRQEVRRIVREELSQKKYGRTRFIRESQERPLWKIANEIRDDWKPVYFGAKPYLDAMSSLNSINDNYGFDSGWSIVAYFLANASKWKGDVARRVKKELKQMMQ